MTKGEIQLDMDLKSGPGYLIRYSDSLRAGWSRYRTPVGGDEIFRTRPERPTSSCVILFISHDKRFALLHQYFPKYVCQRPKWLFNVVTCSRVFQVLSERFLRWFRLLLFIPVSLSFFTFPTPCIYIVSYCTLKRFSASFFIILISP
jgi:hypothetical protein